MPGSNFGRDSRNIFAQFSSSMEPISLKRQPVLIVSRWRTVMFRMTFACVGLTRSEKMSVSRSSRESSPSSTAMPMAVPVTLLLME